MLWGDSVALVTSQPGACKQNMPLRLDVLLTPSVEMRELHFTSGASPAHRWSLGGQSAPHRAGTSLPTAAALPNGTASVWHCPMARYQRGTV